MYDDQPHCTYTTFNQFRRDIAKHIGINLDDMAGFEKRGEDVPDGISWDTVNDDIKLFLDHCDCEGHLLTTQARKIAKRLRVILREMYPNVDEMEGMERWDYDMGMKFIAVLEEASKTRQRVYFG